MPLEKQLVVVHCRTRFLKPLAVVKNLPGCDAELTPEDMIALAGALMRAAVECASRPTGKAGYRQVMRGYPLSMPAAEKGECPQ
jgi:hypothetical protein